MSVDQFEEAKKANQNENTAMNEQAKVDGKLKLRLSEIKPAKDRVESFNWQRRFNDSTCSFWLACPLRNGSIARLIGSHPTEYGGDIGLKGFLISQKLFLSISEYHHYYPARGKLKHARISEIAI